MDHMGYTDLFVNIQTFFYIYEKKAAFSLIICQNSQIKKQTTHLNIRIRIITECLWSLDNLE